jgi:hypothetical protein
LEAAENEPVAAHPSSWEAAARAGHCAASRAIHPLEGRERFIAAGQLGTTLVEVVFPRLGYATEYAVSLCHSPNWGVLDDGRPAKENREVVGVVPVPNGHEPSGLLMGGSNGDTIIG